MLRIQLFGPPLVFDDDRPLPIRRRVTRALLFYLVAQGKPVTREHLVDLFWPNSPPDKARSALRDMLGKLRGTLPDREILRTAPEAVSLDFAKLQVDFLELQKQFASINLSAWKIPADSPLPVEIYRQMVESVNLWGGQRFLEGGEQSFSVELDDWAQATEQEVINDAIRVIKRLARHESTFGDPEQALKWLRMAAPYVEFDSQLQQEILETYLKIGAQEAARAYYENLQAVYAPDECPPNLRAFQVRIFSPRLAESPSLPADWAVRPSLQAPFIGHGQMLERLKQAWQLR